MSDDAGTIRIALVDSQPIFRRGARCLIQDEGGIEIVAEAEDGAEALKIVSELEPDIIVLDIHTLSLNGISVIRQMRQLETNTKAIIISAKEDRVYVQEAFSLGAVGYILRKTSDKNFLHAVRAVHGGELYIDRSVLESYILQKFGSVVQRNTSLLRSVLSERERSVIRFIAFGFTGKEISARLGISAKSVETFKARACEKLDIRSRAAIVRYALIQDWLRDPPP